MEGGITKAHIMPQPDKADKADWTEEEDKKIFWLFKEKGTKWKLFTSEMQGRTENEIKNRFYSTLRRVATRSNLQSGKTYKSSALLSKTELLEYVDQAIVSGHSCFSKRGRKKKQSKDKVCSESEFNIGNQQKEYMPPIRLQPAMPVMQRACIKFSPSYCALYCNQPNYSHLLSSYQPYATRTADIVTCQMDLQHIIEHQKTLIDNLREIGKQGMNPLKVMHPIKGIPM